MARKTSRKMCLLFIVMLCLSGCREGVTKVPMTASFSEDKTQKPKYTEIPTKTLTPTLITTSTTITNPADKTEILKPATLSGAVKISGNQNTSFITTLELRGKDTFWLYQTTTTDDEGKFEIHNIEPGDYELWVLITTETNMVSGCENIFVPNNEWHIGVKYQDRAMLLGEVSLKEAFLAAQNFNSSDVKPIGFYAVSPYYNSEVEPEKELALVLSCK